VPEYTKIIFLTEVPPPAVTKQPLSHGNHTPDRSW